MNQIVRIFKKISNHPRITLSFIYFFAHGLMLINGGIFVDDWFHEFLTPDQLYTEMEAGSRIFYGVFYKTVFSYFRNPYLNRGITFFTLLLVTHIFYSILKKKTKVGSFPSFWIASFFAVYPLYYSRICTSNIFLYSQSLGLFSIASYLLLFHYPTKNWLIRILTLTLFFLSFSLNSLIFFYLVPMLLYFNQSRDSSMGILKGGLRWATKNFDLLLIPFIFYIGIKHFFPRYRDFVGYNEVTVKSLIGAFALNNESMISTYHFFINNISNTIKTIILVIVLMSLARFNTNYKKSLAQSGLGLIVGIVLIAIGFFPYSAIERVMEFYGIGDRLAELALFGLAVSLYYFFEFIFSFSVSTNLKFVALSCVLFAMILKDVRSYESFLQGAIKQDAVIAGVAKIPDFLKYKTFLLDDQASEITSNGEPLEDSQMIGILNKVSPTLDMCVSLKGGKPCAELNPSKMSPCYNLSNYVPHIDEQVLVIRHGEQSLDFARTINLSLQKMFGLEAYQKSLPLLFSVSMVPVASKNL